MVIRDAISHRKYWLYLIVLSFSCFPACEEYFLPELEEFDPVLVVDGAITDRPGPYTIRLSFSSGIFPNDQRAVEGAVVTIMEEDGDEETLTENEAGYYATSDNGIRGTAGKNYKISIQLQDGTLYESPYQEMPSSIAIDTVEADLVTQYLSIEEPDVPGYQFHVTTEPIENNENYLMWLPESTYKYRSDFTLDYIYTNRNIAPYPNPTEFMTCWRTDKINEIFTFNTSGLIQPKIERLPLHFVRADQREMSIRYSLLVKQLTINEEAYTFWNNLQRQIENQETLYNVQPFQIRGNLFNVDNPEETVLGFFMVAGLSEKRIFVDRAEASVPTFSYCEPDYMSFSLISLIHSSSWPIYIYEDETGARAIANEECFDCRELDGTTTRPDFWKD